MEQLNIGDKAPEFTGLNENGETVNLSDYKGKGLILFIYPKDDTPGCTKEACNLRDNFRALKKLGYKILGVSPDKYTKHRKFIDKYEFQFPLLADPEKEIINAYGCWGPKKFMGREFLGVKRTTFIIDKNGVIEYIIDKVKTGDHSQQIIDLVNQTETV